MNPISSVLNLRLLTLGHTVITPLSLGTAIVIMLLAFGAARLVSAVLTRARSRARHAGAPLYIVQKVATYGLVLAGVFVGMSTLGIDLSSLAVFAGAIGVGVGLGLQGVVKEFVSGLVLIFDNALHVGDFIELEAGKTRGHVIEIGARATHIRTNDDVDLLVPNSKLIEGVITNWTMGGETRRIHVPFQVAYGVDKARVRAVVLKAAHDLPFTAPDTEHRKTQVWMTAIGDSGLNFELVVWPQLEAVKRPASMIAAYTWAIEDALSCAGIEIPFPQVDVRLRSLFGREGDEAVRTLGLKGGDHAAPATARASDNDAALDTTTPRAVPPNPAGEPRS